MITCYSYCDQAGWWHTVELINNEWKEVSVSKTGRSLT